MKVVPSGAVHADTLPYKSPHRKHDRKFFYKYVNAEVAKIILATRKLRWSSPIGFNDPFDLPEELPLAFDASHLQSAITAHFATAIREPQLDSKDPLVRIVNRFVSNVDSAARNEIAQHITDHASVPTADAKLSFEMFKEFWKEEVKNLRVLCLAESNDVTTMWAYYSDDHRGFVLEFEAVDSLDSVFVAARGVTYQNETPEAITLDAWVHALSGGDAFARMFIEDYPYFKTKDWAHEREWRLASFKRPGEEGLFSDYGFHPRELTGVYIGLRASDEDRRDILSLLSYDLGHVARFEAFADGAKSKIAFRALNA